MGAGLRCGEVRWAEGWCDDTYTSYVLLDFAFGLLYFVLFLVLSLCKN